LDRLPDLLVIHGEWRMARLLRATLQCDIRLLNSFLDLLFKAEPLVAEKAKISVLKDHITATGEKARYDLELKFSDDLFRRLYPNIAFNNINIELKDEWKARTEKNQISRYLQRAGKDRALVAYIRLDDDPNLAGELIEGISVLEHPRYLCPTSGLSNFTWEELIQSLFCPQDARLKDAWIRAVQVFCEKKLGHTPTFTEIKKTAEKTLSLEQPFLSCETLASYVESVCDVYSMNIHCFQREYLKPALEAAIREKGIEASITVKGFDCNKIAIDLPNRIAILKSSETLPVNRRACAAHEIEYALRAPCSWFDPGDGYVPKAELNGWFEFGGRPVFPYLKYESIETLAKAIANCIC